MFDKAYICIIADPQIGHNTFEFDGRYGLPIVGGPNIYKISTGKHSVLIKSGTGEEWTVDANVGYGELLTIKVALSGENICDVMYKVGSAPAGMGWGAMSLD